MIENKESSYRKFLTNLQLEYLTHKMRSLVYQNKVYAEVSHDISEKKKNKIKELSIRFKLPTIFTSDKERDEFIKREFWQPYGLPNFQYKDEEQKRVQWNYDAWYCLYRGVKVKYKGEEAAVISNNPTKKEIKIRINGKDIIVSYLDISLINNLEWT